MSGFSRKYVKQMAKEFGYYATWLPTNPIKLGDIGVISKKYVFVRVDNISNLGIQFQKRQDATKDTIDYQTSGAVNMDLNVSADPNLPNAPIKTKLAYTFKKNNSVIFKANDVKADSIENQNSIATEIMELFANKKWRKKYRVVTELISAGSTTIIIANSKSSKLELSAKGDVSGKIDIANAKLGFSITSNHEMNYTEIAASGLSPLFRLSGIFKKGLLGGGVGPFQPLSLIRGPEALDLVNDQDIIDRPDEFYFGVDDLEDLWLDDFDENDGS